LLSGDSFRLRGRRLFLFGGWSFFDRTRSFLNDLDNALCSSLFLGEVLVSDLLGQLFGNGVGRNADVDTLASHFFYKPLGVEL
jgi:hypothetical protein